MAVYTKYKNLEKPLSTEKYNVGVANKNSDVIDSELHKLDLKNESQDTLLATKESLTQHTDNTENPHNVTKSQVGLGNVDNTADLDKPVSDAQRAAINDIYVQTNSYVDVRINGLIDDAPETHNTLKKLSDAVTENETNIDALNEDLEGKANKTELNNYLPLTGGTLETSGSPILKLKRTGANSARIQFEGANGYEFTLEGFRDSKDVRTFNIFLEDKDNTSLFRISEIERNIYDYKSKSVKEIIVEGDPSTSLNLPRIDAGDANYKPGKDIFEVKEFGSKSDNIPTSAYYHVITMQGNDVKEDYVTQLAVGMTTDAIYYRRFNINTWEAWHKILLQGDESGSCANDFILINQQSLTFTDNICIISDNRITSDSLADVHFTTDTIDIAESADISVETYDGNVKLTASNSPTGTIKATIRIRVV